MSDDTKGLMMGVVILSVLGCLIWATERYDWGSTGPQHTGWVVEFYDDEGQKVDSVWTTRYPNPHQFSEGVTVKVNGQTRTWNGSYEIEATRGP